MERKGQAAMEFLMTYGWAILAAIIAIGVLAWFGVFSPGRLTQDTIFIGAPLGSNAAKVNTTHVTIDLQNGAGETINVTSLTVGSCTPLVYGQSIAAGSSSVIMIPCALAVDTTLRGTISISYLKSTSTIEQTSTGTITYKVKAA